MRPFQRAQEHSIPSVNKRSRAIFVKIPQKSMPVYFLMGRNLSLALVRLFIVGMERSWARLNRHEESYTLEEKNLMYIYIYIYA